MLERRDFIKSGVGLAAIMSSRTCPSAIVKSLVGASSASAETDFRWSSPYQDRSLIHMWDGIENAGYNIHDEYSLVWKDLIGDSDFMMSGSGWTADSKGIGLSGTSGLVFPYEIENMASTFSIVVRGLTAADYKVGYNYCGYAVRFGWDRRGSTIATLGLNLLVSDSSPAVPMFGIHYRGRENNSSNTKWESTGPDMTITFRILGHNWSGVSSAECFVNGVKQQSSSLSMKDSGWTDKSMPKTSNVSSAVEICNIRIYDRHLSDNEIAYGADVDKDRFNLEWTK